MYPKDPDGYGETSLTSRPLKEGEVVSYCSTPLFVMIEQLDPGGMDPLGWRTTSFQCPALY